MQFRVTSVACSETATPLREVTVRVEDWLNKLLGDGNFGVGADQLTIVAISIDDDTDENLRWAKAHEKTGRFKHLVTGESVSYISVSVALAPGVVTTRSPIELLNIFCASAIHRLKSQPARVPKGFEYERCFQAVSTTLAACT